ncbi:MAG: D-arabinono-1,4-lactone oxidase [Actinomycetota bacterium]
MGSGSASLVRAKRDRAFVNWGRNQRCLPVEWRSPTSTTEVAEIVAGAAARGERVKVVGAGHSFTAAACTDGVLLSLDHLDQLTDHDPDTREVTVGAGIRLSALNEALHALGLAMPNLGDIAYQSLAGATATATHGTGVSLGNLSTNIVGFEIVTGTGDVMWCDATSNPDVFTAGRVSIGALGIITRIRLRCVPSFVLRAAEGAERLDDVLDDWDGFVASARHAEFFHFFGARTAFTKRNQPTDEAEQPPTRLQFFLEKDLAENGAFEVANRIVRRFPSQRKRMLGLIGKATSSREVVDRSYRVFASPRRVRFVEMEYGLPFDAVPEAVQRVRAMAADLDRTPLFPIEVRASAADDIPLSTAEGRRSGWIAVHQYIGIPFGDYFRAVEAIMDDYEGRPHWGKMHGQTHDVLRERYPRWDEFAKVRSVLDPQGVFRNDYLDRVLGPVI